MVYDLTMSKVSKVSEAASILGRRSAAARIRKWGKKGFVERLRLWGKLGGWPKGRPRKPSKSKAKKGRKA